jgi:hypothetical protein
LGDAPHVVPPHRRIGMAIEITSDLPAFFVVANLLLPITIAK